MYYAHRGNCRRLIVNLRAEASPDAKKVPHSPFTRSNPVKAWYSGLPPLTRVWWTLSLLSACFVYFGTVSGSTISWSWPLVAGRFHVWRLVTNFCFVGTWGKNGFNTLISLYMLQQYSANYERNAINTGGGGGEKGRGRIIALFHVPYS